MFSRRIALSGVAVLLASCGPLAGAPEAGSPSGKTKGVRITRLEDRLRVEINGALFTEYFFKDVPRPFCYPLIGPGDLPMTRNWPMKNSPDEEHDHPHHRSLWFAHGAVNGHDFWSEQKDFGRIVHDDFAKVTSSKSVGVIREKNKWVAADGSLVCTDKRELRIYNSRNSTDRSFDFEITLQAPEHPVTFGDTKEGSMAMRLAETMRFKGKVGHGHIINSAGDRDDATWGKRANWCDYCGPVNGKTVGVAIFDHPKNPRHPTWWHVRDYGLFAANPFGRHDFEKLEDKEAGNLTIPARGHITFRYRFILHEGDEQQAHIAEKYDGYLKSKKP